MREVSEALEFLEFWISSGHGSWFSGGAKFDQKCQRFEMLWERASSGECEHWKETSAGSLALIVLLDQIPRNIFRGAAKQFSTDEMARNIADYVIESGFDKVYELPLKSFFYMPFMHSEDLSDQHKSCDLFRPLKDQNQYYYALVHMDAIARFGRFPHRNKMLGRVTTPQEAEYLKTGGFGG